MTIIQPNNPAARLYIILDKLRQTDENQTIEDGWSYALNHKSDQARLRTKIGAVYGLPSEIHRQLQRLPRYNTEQMAWWEEMSYGLMGNRLNDNWANVGHYVSRSALGQLRFCADTLADFAPEPVFGSSVVQDLKDYIEQIRSEIDPDNETYDGLYGFLKQRLDIMESVLDDVQIIGAASADKPLKEAAAQVENRINTVKKESKSQTLQSLEEFAQKVRAVRLIAVSATIAIAAPIVGTREITDALVQIRDNAVKLLQPESLVVRETKQLEQSMNDSDITDADFAPAKTQDSSGTE